MNLTTAYAAHAEDLAALYRDLHRHPELGHQEVRSARLMAERLRQGT